MSSNDVRTGPGAPAVGLHGVTKRFGAVEALSDVTLVVPAGQVVAILGPNGAGKTTAISVMTGLRRPTSGEARLLGLPPGHRRARSQRGVMLQDAAVPPNLRLVEIVDLFRACYGSPLPTSTVLAMAGLAHKARTFAGVLSGGERQRLLYGIAICGDPRVLFLDEPSVGMDVEARRGFWADIRRFAESGRTIVLTTHYLEEADQLAERIVVVDRGRIIADATPAELKARLPSRRVSFRFDGELDEAAFDGVPRSDLTLSDHSASMLTNDPELTLTALFRRRLPVHSLEVAGAGLEDAFLSLTRRRDDDR